MPLYEFENVKTGEVFEEFLSISEREEYLKANPDIRQNVYMKPIGDPILQGQVKPPADFRGMLTRMKKGNPGSTINDW